MNTKKLNINKKAMAMNVLFYIMMSIVMVWIIIFGYQKIFTVQSTISESDRVQLKNDLKNTFEYCDDPLNKGNFKIVNIDLKSINGVCILGSNQLNPQNSYSQYTDFTEIYKAGNNVVLIDSTYTQDPMDETKYTINQNDYNVIDSFNISIDDPIDNICWFDTDYDGIIKFKVECN